VALTLWKVRVIPGRLHIFQFVFRRCGYASLKLRDNCWTPNQIVTGKSVNFGRQWKSIDTTLLRIGSATYRMAEEEKRMNETITGEVKRRSTWTIIMGIVIVLLGIVLIAHPFAAATIMTLMLGWALILVGVAQFVFALHSHTVGRFFLKALYAVLFVIAGIALAFFPVAGLATLTAMLGAFLLIEAGVLIVTAFHMRPGRGWGWFLFDGLASLLLGILILAHWPSSSIWAIGTLVGFAVLMSGFSRIMIASRIRGGASAAEEYMRHA
jgi:uncharacterized membrane protein HdeD (DUF308 family)